MTETLGRFNHHPNPAIDFEVEVECIESQLFDMTHGVMLAPVLGQRIERAMEFRVGGDLGAIAAKDLLRKLEREYFSCGGHRP